jgi:hypothetical protein
LRFDSRLPPDLIGLLELLGLPIPTVPEAPRG